MTKNRPASLVRMRGGSCCLSFEAGALAATKCDGPIFTDLLRHSTLRDAVLAENVEATSDEAADPIGRSRP